MQRLTLSFLALFFAIAVLGISVAEQVRFQVHAQAGILSLPPSPSPTLASKSFDSPGWLPSHPLYPVKMASDKVVLWLSTNPETRIDHRLTYADRRMAAGTALIAKGEFDIGITTLFKGVHYLEQAVQELEEIDGDTTQLKEKAGAEAILFEKTLTEIKNVLPDPARPAVETLIQRVMSIKDRLGVKS